MKFEQLNPEEQGKILKDIQTRLEILKPSLDTMTPEQQILFFKNAYLKELKEHHATVILDTKAQKLLLDDIERLKNQIK